MKPSKWINNSLDEIEELKEKFESNKPFPHLSISNFLNEDKAQELLNSLKIEEYYLEEHDLYEFERTVDLKDSKNMIIQDLRSFLTSKDFIQVIEELTQTSLNPNKLDLHSLKLKNTHYLLCHDDQVQKRSIAFIINLSLNWKKEYGGELQFFSSENNLPKEVELSITPEFNQFNIFNVSNKSFHQISEVITDKERISLSGWYYEK